MSDQRRTGAVISLEEIFRSREFGRRPARWDAAPVTTVEAADPPQLEEVFLSELFGHPEAIAAAAPSHIGRTGAPVERPTLVLLRGGEDTERDVTRYRGAIGAVSGVAAAALVVAGMSSAPGSRSEQPTISALGEHPGHGSAPGGGGQRPAPGGAATQPNAPGAGANTGPVSAATGGSSGAGPMAQLVAATTPATPAVTVTAPPPAPVEVVPPPPAPGGGTPAPGPSPGGGGSVLTPAFAAVGNTVSTVGATVTAASNDLAHAVPAASPVTGLLANVGATVTSLGSSVTGA
jgi:translation initiation factor IF-2